MPTMWLSDNQSKGFSMIGKSQANDLITEIGVIFCSGGM